MKEYVLHSILLLGISSGKEYAMHKAYRNNKIAEVISSAKTVGTVAQKLRSLDKIIGVCDTPIDDVVVMIYGDALAYVTNVNGFKVPVDEEDCLVHYKSFREVLELARAEDLNTIAVVKVDGNGYSDDFYITGITFEVFNLEANYSDGKIGCRVLLA